MPWILNNKYTSVLIIFFLLLGKFIETAKNVTIFLLLHNLCDLNDDVYFCLIIFIIEKTMTKKRN